jgi:succinate dehydrogenase/fumarate reductase flavoprotein subunit
VIYEFDAVVVGAGGAGLYAALETSPEWHAFDTVKGGDCLFDCTRVCPRAIKITKLINQTKRKIQEYHES